MATEILKSFGTLQSELEQARSSLKGVDESIKRLIGRDPSELPLRPPVKRGQEDRGRPNRIVRTRTYQTENEEPPAKRRTGVSVFKRLSERPVHYKEEPVNKQMISKVIVTPKEIPSRQEALAAQSRDVKSKERNRRMFGALLGTLQKFQQEETKLKQREEKRAQLEKKIEEHEIKEKEEIKKERQELFLNRKKKQAEIKMIELKMLRMKEYAAWVERQKPRMNFIKTKAKPHIHFLPRKLNNATKELLAAHKTEVQKMIDAKRQEVSEELQKIEDRMRRNFEDKTLRKEVKPDQDQEDEEEEEEDDYNEDEKHKEENETKPEKDNEDKDKANNDENNENHNSTREQKEHPEENESKDVQTAKEVLEQNDAPNGIQSSSIKCSENGTVTNLSWGEVNTWTESALPQPTAVENETVNRNNSEDVESANQVEVQQDQKENGDVV